MIVGEVEVNANVNSPAMNITGKEENLKNLFSSLLGDKDLIIDVTFGLARCDELLVYSDFNDEGYILIPVNNKLYYYEVNKQVTLTNKSFNFRMGKGALTPEMISEKFDSVFNDKGFIVTNTICKDVYDAF